MEKENLSLDKKIALNLPLNEEENQILINRMTKEYEKKKKLYEKCLKDNPPQKPKTWEEKVLSGEEALPKDLKIVNGKLEQKTEKELFKEGIISKEEYSEIQRNERNYFLMETDKYLLNDFPISEEELKIVKNYRNYLRDIPQNEKFPDLEILSLEEFKKL